MSMADKVLQEIHVDQPEVLKEGVLYKRGKRLSARSMERYYVILSTGVMRYFKVQGPPGTDAAFWPRYGSLGVILKATSQNNRINIVTKDREHTLIANTQVEAHEWSRII